MAQITIRGIDPEIEKEIRKKAMEIGQSLNNVVLDIIHNRFVREKKPLHNVNSLKALAVPDYYVYLTTGTYIN